MGRWCKCWGGFLPLLARFAKLSVDAFEPAPGPLRQLQRHLALNPMLAMRLRLHTVALSNETGGQAFFQSAQAENQGIGSLASMGDTLADAIEVACALGDDLIDSGEAARPDLIKIDVEGCELKVLMGLKHTLEESHPVVLAEHSPYRLQQAGIGRHEVRDFMRALGYNHIGKIGLGGSVTDLDERDLESSCDLVFSLTESFAVSASKRRASL